MNLEDFESEIEERILSRGMEYFQNGKITDLRMEGNHYAAIAHGTENYHVEAVIDDDGEILASSCDCPYDYGDHCKHQIALFFAIRHGDPIQNKEEKRREPQASVQSIEQVIHQLSKRDLETLLVTFASHFEEVDDQIRFHCGTDHDKLRVAKEIIKFHLRKAKHHGFIEASDAYSAFTGVRIVFEEALSCDSLETGIALCILGIETVLSVDEVDDSDGIIMEMYENGKETIEQLLSDRLDSESAQTKKTIFKQMMQMMNKLWMEDLSYTGGELLEVLLLFCHIPDFAKEYRSFLADLETRILNQSDSSEIYGLESLEILELHLFEALHDSEGRAIFIQNHLANPAIREIAIHEAMADKRQSDALALITAGIEVDSKAPGLIKRWNHLAFQVHTNLHNLEEIQSLSEKFLLEGEIAYYDAYLDSFPLSGHDAAANAILMKFEQKRLVNDTYIDILIREKKQEKLMALCEQRSSRIETLYPFLVDAFRERVNECFKRDIREYAAQTIDRRGYRRVCDIIKTFRNVFPQDSLYLIKELIINYSRRPAMVDELKKLTILK